MLGGDEYPSTAIGINLPNADWIRAEHGSKSITISNITDAYNKASHGSGFKEEFVIDQETLALIEKYGDACDDLHTDLHECLGHGSGQLLPGTDPDALKAYGNTIEEARADLFGLYYIADHKLVELELLPDDEAYKAQYYSYVMNGLMTQLIRIEPGRQIEEAHMRNRALIAHWCYEQGNGVIKMERHEGRTFVRITDYQALRQLFARLLAEIQRIKSEGDFEAARQLVERYAVKVDADLHAEVLERYKKLNLAPYKGFLNPLMKPVVDENGDICDIQLDYSESYTQQMLRYGQEYGTL
jgi:dipeptidyl-peptidase-3